MGDRMFASEGDSVNVGRLGSTAHADRWEESHPVHDPGGDAATGWLARRLQGRLDRQQWLLDQHLQSQPSALPELLEISRRMRRDTELLQLLSGDEAGLRPAAARRLADTVTEAVSAAEEPSRVVVRSAPGAAVAPVASVEFGHVLSAVIDHVTVAYPDARVDLASRVESRGGITVDLAVDGAMRTDADGDEARCTQTVAEQLAQRSRNGIEVRRPAGGPPSSGSGLVLSVYCPATAVTVDEPVWPSTSSTGDRFRARANGTGAHQPVRGNGYSPALNPTQNTGSHPTGRNGFDHQPNAFPSERSGGFYGTQPPGEATGPGRAAAYTDGYGGVGGSGSYRGGFDPLNDPLPGAAGGDAYRGYGDSGYSDYGTGTNRAVPGSAGSTASGSYPAAGNGYPGYTGNGTGNGYAGNGNGYPGNGYTGNGYAANGTGNGYNGNGYAENGTGNGYAANGNGYTGNGNGHTGNGNGNGHTGNGNGYAGTGNGYAGNGYGTNGSSGYAGADPGYRDPASGNGYGATGYSEPAAYDAEPAYGSSSLTGPSLPAYQPSRSSGVDELFGPLLDLPIEPMDDRFATPIFEAIASVWFREEQEAGTDGRQEGSLDWESPNDAEWRAASERAGREPVAESLTSTGLPRRRPGGQLVPPPLSRRPAPSAGPAERVPDRVRDRLSTYQRGLRQGRHRSPDERSEYGEW